jgi:hypothetical protein
MLNATSTNWNTYVVRGGGEMLVEEHKNGNTTIRIYDDFIRSKEESIEILQRVADNMLRQLNAQEKTA